MEALLQRLVEQNDALIGLSNTQIEALQAVVDKLGEIQAQLILGDSAGDVSSILSEVQLIAEKLDD